MNSESRPVRSRIGRLTRLGQLAGSIAGGALAEGVRQISRGKRPVAGDLLLAPDNLRQIADRLAEMRGAAMKIGQLISLEAGEVLPPVLADTLSRLWENAHFMPLGQVGMILDRGWGDGWQQRFHRFSFTPVAAASIGQVHEAVLRTGERVAIKIQYPGIRQSIDSDMDNVGLLLRLAGVLPRGLEVGDLVAEGKRELRAEADYLQEAEFIGEFQRLLSGDDRFVVPEVIDDLTTPGILAMRYLDGQPIEILEQMDQDVRDSAANALLELALLELFRWGLVQTDPNFANFRYDPDRNNLQLLDFGATRRYSTERREHLGQLLRACHTGKYPDIERAAIEVGYLGQADPPGARSAIVMLLRTATEPLRLKGPYPFGTSNLAGRMSEILMELRLDQKYGRIPPLDVLYLHRKLAGLYMLFSRLGARLDANRLVQPFL